MPKPSPPQPPVAWAPDNRLPLYELALDNQDLAALVRNPLSRQTFPASFKANGIAYDGIRVRLRGNSSRSFPKKSFKVLFNPDHLFEGHRSLNLNSCWHDPAYLREALSYYIYAQCGLATPQCRMVQLLINGQFFGLYADVEQPDKTFLERANLGELRIYKAIETTRAQGFAPIRLADERELGEATNYTTFYRLETQKTAGFEDLQRFCAGLAQAPNTLDFFTQHMDLERYIDYLAGSVLTQNWNCFDKNHLLIFDARGSHRWFVLPWDLDRTLGDHWYGSHSEIHLPILLGTRLHSQSGRWNRLADHFFREPVLLARFLDRLERLLQESFTPERLFPVLDRLEAQVAPTAAADRRFWPNRRDLRQEVAVIKFYIEQRRAFLLSEIPKLRNPELRLSDQRFDRSGR